MSYQNSKVNENGEVVHIYLTEDGRLIEVK